ncbi:hypothetical protein [Paenibacillus abyssi]|uniref:Uncharacterized protein n=1 Tax=Paenibacillus abyssi TaxID=1340531 RepID=A0A917G0I0_9BACL|nr:hypothetical protein [Paenibacillus abyssi]GGG16585.1 hypothetical protein GCM10010916_36800 [Paenibacillus abyssi]
MFIQNQWLENQVDFDNAMFLRVPVSVWRGNKFIDYGGLIREHDIEAVFIADDCFLKTEFRFKIRSSSAE